MSVIMSQTLLIVTILHILFNVGCYANKDPEIIVESRKHDDFRNLVQSVPFSPDVKLGHDMVFLDKGTAFANPGRATIVKEIKFRSLRENRNDLQNVAALHQDCCNNISALLRPMGEKYLILKEEGPTTWEHARDLCVAHGHHLPEVHGRTDRYHLGKFMMENRLKAVHAGLIFDESVAVTLGGGGYNGLEYASSRRPIDDAKAIHNPVCPNVTHEFVDYVFGSKSPGFWYDAYNQVHTPLAQYPIIYRYEHGVLQICPNVQTGHPSGFPYTPVCQRRNSPTDRLHARDLEEFCHARQDIINNTLVLMENSVAKVESSFNASTAARSAYAQPLVQASEAQPQVDDRADINDFQAKILQHHMRLIKGLEAGKNGQGQNSDTDPLHSQVLINSLDQGLARHSLSKRAVDPVSVVAVGTLVLAGISALVNVLTQLYLNSVDDVLDEHQKALEALTFNSKYLAQELTDLKLNLSSYATESDRYYRLTNNEQFIFSAFGRMESNIKDNLLDVVSTLSNAVNNIVTLRMVTPDDLRLLNDKVSMASGHFLSQDISTFEVEPVYKDDRLFLAIRVPIISLEQRVHIYSAFPLPLFRNGVKYQTHCTQKFIAVYEHSSHWSDLTELEAIRCLDRKKTCTISGTKNQVVMQSCASVQYFQQSHPIILTKSTDTAPVIINHNDTIVFSIPDKNVDLMMHCRNINHVGADKVVKISDRGIVLNSDSCEYEIPRYGVSFQPPSYHPNSHEGKPISNLFSLGEHAFVVPPPIRNLDFNLTSGNSVLENMVDIKAPRKPIRKNNRQPPTLIEVIIATCAILVSAAILVCVCWLVMARNVWRRCTQFPRGNQTPTRDAIPFRPGAPAKSMLKHKSNSYADLKVAEHYGQQTGARPKDCFKPDRSLANEWDYDRKIRVSPERENALRLEEEIQHKPKPSVNTNAKRQLFCEIGDQNRPDLTKTTGAIVNKVDPVKEAAKNLLIQSNKVANTTTAIMNK